MKSPKVNIFIPLYNSENTIRDTLNSLLHQSYDNFSIIISDNHSTDNSLKIISDFADERIRVIKTPSFSKSEDNFNRCIDLSDEDFTALLHSDDIYHKDFLQNQVSNLLSNENIAISFTEGNNIDVNGNYLRDLKTPNEMNFPNLSFKDLYPLILKNYNFIIMPSLVFRTKYFKENNFYLNHNEFKTSSDLGLWLEISLKYKVSFIKKNLISVRQSSVQISSKVRDQTSQSDFFLVLDKFSKYFSINKKNSKFIQFNTDLLKTRDNLRILCNLIYLNQKKSLSESFSRAINLNIILKSYKKKYMNHLLLYIVLRFFNLIGFNKVNYNIVSYLKKKYLI